MRFALALLVAAAGCGGSSHSTGDFAIPPDMAQPIDASGLAGFPCDVVGQTGCDPGLHCTVGMIGQNGADLCEPTAQDPLPVGSPCSPVSFGFYTGDLCTPGTACVDYAGVSLCRPLCFRHSDCASLPNSYCVGPTNSPTMKMTNFGSQPLSACIQDTGCDPVAQTGCPAGFGCYLAGEDSAGRPAVCESGYLTGKPGADCQRQRDCAPGEECAELGFCRALCYLDQASGACADPSLSCGPIFGSSTYGDCD